MRYAISSFEEQWVRICYKFFETYGFYNWHEVDKQTAFKFMMITSNKSYTYS
jgi:hypothetical protein